MVTVIKKGTPIDKMKRLLSEAFSKTPSKNIRQYAGVLQTDVDPMHYQKQMRDEWNRFN